MEYIRLLPFLAVLVTLLTVDLPVSSARRKTTPPDPPSTLAPADDIDSGSGYDDDDNYNGRHYDSDDDIGSGDDDGGSGDGGSPQRPPVSHPPDIVFDNASRSRTTTGVYTVVDLDRSDNNVKVEALKTLLMHPAVLAAIIIGGVLTILFIVLLIMFIIYRMRKRDEGSYVLDDPKVAMIDHQQPQQTNALIYTKGPSNDQEFYA